jgi:hypothetical protein
MQRIGYRFIYYAPPPSRLTKWLHDETVFTVIISAKEAQQSLASISGWPFRPFSGDALNHLEVFSRILGSEISQVIGLLWILPTRRFRLEEDLLPDHRRQLPILLDIYPPLPSKSANKIEIGMVPFTISTDPLPVCYMCSLIT